MSYIPTIWQAGDIITAEKLNKLENAIAEVQAIYNLMENDPTTLMTGDDLYAAIQDNPDSIFYIHGDQITSIEYYVEDDEYDIATFNYRHYMLGADDTILVEQLK